MSKRLGIPEGDTTMELRIGKKTYRFHMKGSGNNRALTAADDADAKNGNAPRIIGVRRDGAIVRQLPKDSDRTER